MNKILFNIREFLWVCVSEVEDWLYPYRKRLTPEERFDLILCCAALIALDLEVLLDGIL